MTKELEAAIATLMQASPMELQVAFLKLPSADRRRYRKQVLTMICYEWADPDHNNDWK